MKLIPFHINYKKGIAIDPITKKPVLDEKTGKPLEVFHPLIPLVFSSPAKETRPTEGLLDSGADGIVIPKGLADYLELEMKPSDKPMRVANGSSVQRFTSKVTVKIGRGGRFSDPFEADVSIPVEGNPPILIGRDPIFKLFIITFVEAERRFEMKPYS
jgi:predicted aspartyl protease